jgi:hypothetical protein
LQHLTRRDVLVLLFGLSVAPVVFLGRMWKANADRGGQQPAEPFRIAGNFYYVGANDVTSFLITSQAPPRKTRWTRSSTPRATARTSTPPRQNSEVGSCTSKNRVSFARHGLPPAS